MCPGIRVEEIIIELDGVLDGLSGFFDAILSLTFCHGVAYNLNLLENVVAAPPPIDDFATLWFVRRFDYNLFTFDLLVVLVIAYLLDVRFVGLLFFPLSFLLPLLFPFSGFLFLFLFFHFLDFFLFLGFGGVLYLL